MQNFQCISILYILRGLFFFITITADVLWTSLYSQGRDSYDYYTTIFSIDQIMEVLFNLLSAATMIAILIFYFKLNRSIHQIDDFNLD